MKPFNKMTPEEHKRLSSKGGTNSAISKKKERNLEKKY